MRFAGWPGHGNVGMITDDEPANALVLAIKMDPRNLVISGPKELRR